MDAIINKTVDEKGDFKIKYEALINRITNMYNKITKNKNLANLLNKNYDIKVTAVSNNLSNPLRQQFDI